jgi:catechol 2,3-dioxygenase-like lactoylglutathione lyase family enzyme
MTFMRKLQSQGVHHITLVGAGRQTSIDFWEGMLGMPFVFEQPNLDNAAESHLHFDPGDGRLITVLTKSTLNRVNFEPRPEEGKGSEDSGARAGIGDPLSLGRLWPLDYQASRLP